MFDGIERLRHFVYSIEHDAVRVPGYECVSIRICCTSPGVRVRVRVDTYDCIRAFRVGGRLFSCGSSFSGNGSSIVHGVTPGLLDFGDNVNSSTALLDDDLFAVLRRPR